MDGSIVKLLPHIRTLTSWLPFVRRLHKSRAALAMTARRSVADAIENYKSGEKVHTLLNRLIEAKDPVTGAKLDVDEINSEAFGFL
jgi:hypothetical protein